MCRFAPCTTAVFVSALVLRMAFVAEPSHSAGLPQIDLALDTGSLRAVNRDVTVLPDNQGVHVTENPGPGVVWIEGSDFAQGTIEVDVRGRDVPGRSFVGVAFHRQDDNTYDAVYLRPSISERPTLVGASTPCSTSRFPSTTGRRSDNSFQESSRIRSTAGRHRLRYFGDYPVRRGQISRRCQLSHLSQPRS